MPNYLSKYFADQEARQKPAARSNQGDHSMAIAEREYAVSLLARNLSALEKYRLKVLVSHLSYRSSVALCDYVFELTHRSYPPRVDSFEEAKRLLAPWIKQPSSVR